MANSEPPSIFPTIWQVLHDGEIIRVEGSVPGTVQLTFSIDYLRSRFSDPGQSIRVNLENCVRFAYSDFQNEKFTSDLSAIEAMRPEVLYAEMIGKLCRIECAAGTLEVIADDAVLSLDNGRIITIGELLDVSKAYWAEWSKSAEQGAT